MRLAGLVMLVCSCMVGFLVSSCSIGRVGGDARCTKDSDGHSCNDGNACTADDTCEEGQCVGKPIRCDAPPRGTCLDDNNLWANLMPGICINGECSYPRYMVTCKEGCEEGACVGEPCAGKSCNTPPDGICSNTSTLRTYQSPGSCDSDGNCTYAYTEITCENGCNGGACAGDPCVGKSCTTPPAYYCANSHTLRTYQSPGVCTDDGSCSYQEKEIACQFGCELGVCKGDPCAGKVCDSPPTNYCLDGTTLRIYTSNGHCDSEGTCPKCGTKGVCVYDHNDTTCTHGCANGSCKGDPCLGKACDSPPADYCTGADTLRSFSAKGTCSDGVCEYTHTDTTCAPGCSDGQCEPPPVTDGAVPPPDGGVPAPDGGAVSPDGTTVAPDGTTVAPDGTSLGDAVTPEDGPAEQTDT